MMNIALSLPYTPSSCCQITRSIGLAPRPPYSFGQCGTAQPASAFFFCQALATSRMLAPVSWVRPSEDLRKSSSYCFGALAAIHAFASARNAASCGVSSKFIRVVLCEACHSGRSAACGSIRNPEVTYLEIPGSKRSAAPRNDVSESSRIPLAHPVDQRIFPMGQAAERQRHRVGAPIIHVAVEFPGEAHAAMHLDIVLGAM